MEPSSSSSMTIYSTTSPIIEPISVTTTDISSSYIAVSTTSSIATSDTTSLPPVMEPPSSFITTASISTTSLLNATITLIPGQGNAGNDASTILIIAVIALLVVIIIVLLIVSVRVFRKKRKLSLPVSSSTMNDSNSNCVSIDVSSAGNDKGRLGAVNYPNYQLQGIHIESIYSK